MFCSLLIHRIAHSNESISKTRNAFRSTDNAAHTTNKVGHVLCEIDAPSFAPKYRLMFETRTFRTPYGWESVGMFTPVWKCAHPMSQLHATHINCVALCSGGSQSSILVEHFRLAFLFHCIFSASFWHFCWEKGEQKWKLTREYLLCHRFMLEWHRQCQRYCSISIGHRLLFCIRSLYFMSEQNRLTICAAFVLPPGKIETTQHFFYCKTGNLVPQNNGPDCLFDGRWIGPKCK